MEPNQIIAIVIFLTTIGFIIWGKIERSVIGILGVVWMVILGIMTEKEAFFFVDWNVIAILFSIWIIAGYFEKTGIPEYLAIVILKGTRNNLALFVILLGSMAAFISMFVDNVVVILMMAPVVLHITRQLKVPSFPILIFVGLAANLMGTALLLGDLPPQMLHSVAGIEFSEFIWMMGRPSSFIILTITFTITAFLFYKFRYKKIYSGTTIDRDALARMATGHPGSYIKNTGFTLIIVSGFVATILAMAFRQLIGLQLGFIASTGMILVVLVMETWGKRFSSPSFKEVVDELDMSTLFFYITLFILVGGIDHSGILELLADSLTPYVQRNVILGTSLVYWVTAPIVSVVEHDAYILAFLYLVRDMADSTNINPWPLWWATLWAGTLG
ncbi:MAG: SLC13 family permease, partial [Dehalococcoidia bacterium]|nr:SLC13 family permease [Dehalococcoidia bacterium]